MKDKIDRWFSQTNEEWNAWLSNWVMGWAIAAILITMIASPCHSQTIFGRNPFAQEPSLMNTQNYTAPAAWPEYTSGAGFFGWFLSIFKST